MYFLHTDTLTTEETKDYEKFGKDITALNCGFPLIIVTKKGKIIDSNCGELKTTQLYEFLTKHNVIEE